MCVSSYSRYSHPTHKSALRCTTLSTTLSSFTVLSQDLSLSLPGILPDFRHILALVSQMNIVGLLTMAAPDQFFCRDFTR